MSRCQGLRVAPTETYRCHNEAEHLCLGKLLCSTCVDEVLRHDHKVKYVTIKREEGQS